MDDSLLLSLNDFFLIRSQITQTLKSATWEFCRNLIIIANISPMSPAL